EHARRAITEALANTAQHAGARQAWVLLATCDGLLDIEVRDDGVGFEPATIATAGHYGLLGLRERARLAGGDLQIVSAPGRGTSLRLRFPATAEQNGA
ncbi:MAG TPA: ATP-binding protein, partial [Chloroflexia bacterium]|nr:ATP-binding protein [Chloroflexia bacterium]